MAVECTDRMDNFIFLCGGRKKNPQHTETLPQQIVFCSILSIAKWGEVGCAFCASIHFSVIFYVFADNCVGINLTLNLIILLFFVGNHDYFRFSHKTVKKKVVINVITVPTTHDQQHASSLCTVYNKNVNYAIYIGKRGKSLTEKRKSKWLQYVIFFLEKSFAIRNNLFLFS
jgi:hypothetical protein